MPDTSPARRSFPRRLARTAAAVAVATTALASAPVPVVAQDADAGRTPAAPPPFRKGPIPQAAYDAWRLIVSPVLSPDGAWAAYTVSPVDGEGELVVRATNGPAEFRAPRGYTGRPNQKPGASGGFRPAAPEFSADGRHLLALLYPSRDVIDAAKRDRKQRAAARRTALAIVDLPGGAVTTIPRVKEFSLAERDGRVAVYVLEADSAGADSAAADSAEAGEGAPPRAKPPADSAGRSKGPTPETGTPLVIRTLATGEEVRIADVVRHARDRTGHWLAYVVGAADSSRTGLWLRDLAAGTERRLAAGPGRWRDLTFDREGSQLAFLAAPPEDTGRVERERSWTIHRAALTGRRDRRRDVADVRADTIVTRAALDDSLRISERAELRFVREGTALVFGAAPLPADSIPADSLADKAIYDLWHWRDAQLQPTQRIRANRDRNRTYTSVWHARDGRVRRLASDSVPSVTLSADGRLAVASSDERWAVPATWGEGGTDIYVFDTRAGTEARIAERVRTGGRLSPTGRYVTWFDQGDWYAYSIDGGITRNLTEGLRGVSFAQETWDRPSEPSPWGLAGWTPDDASLLAYDRYDVWVLDPDGRAAPRRLTGGVGRARQHRFRVVQLDPEARFVDPAAPILLDAFDDVSKDGGWWRLAAGDSVPEPVRMAPKRWGGLTKARDAERYLVTRSDYREYPDLWAGEDLTALSRISDAMPEMADMSWGDVELVSWLDADGDSLAGLLYVPDDFDPTRRYPMVVYFYEEHSDNLRSFVRPAGRNIVNPVVYTSHDYLVFMPDIAYVDGYPGPSALKSIVPGVQSLIAKGFVDPDAIGVGGQSWGGYQTAFLVTRTNLFAAGVPNAPVSNMTSAYGGIRWGTGISRAGQYEKGQSRIGGSLWEYPERYIENSPLFFLDRVETPLLFMHNDADGAVPWWQGIELFIGLRRLGKEAYLVNYNDDAHNPRKYANQKDIDRKMLEFFGHHLKGESMPSWMARGIPYLEKGRDQLARPVVP